MKLDEAKYREPLFYQKVGSSQQRAIETSVLNIYLGPCPDCRYPLDSYLDE